MTLLKRKIGDRFSAASTSYESVAGVQKHCAAFLVKTLHEYDPLFYPKTILDLGSGTGYIPESLISLYPDSSYTINDVAPNMIQNTKDKFAHNKKFTFFLGDMEELIFQDHDLIVSNLALQWAFDLETTLRKFFLKSKVFSFSCLLEGTFQEWDDIIKSYGPSSILTAYPQEKEMILFLKNLNAQGHHFEIKDFQLTFPNAHSFLSYLKKLGAQTSHTQISPSIVKSLIRNHQREFSVTYKVFFGIIERA